MLLRLASRVEVSVDSMGDASAPELVPEIDSRRINVVSVELAILPPQGKPNGGHERDQNHGSDQSLHAANGNRACIEFMAPSSIGCAPAGTQIGFSA